MPILRALLLKRAWPRASSRLRPGASRGPTISRCGTRTRTVSRAIDRPRGFGAAGYKNDQNLDHAHDRRRRARGGGRGAKGRGSMLVDRLRLRLRTAAADRVLLSAGLPAGAALGLSARAMGVRLRQFQ